jgi:hypothetical protein
VQRAYLYKEGTPANGPEVSRFRSAVVDYVARELLPKYGETLSEEQHFQNIEQLIQHANICGAVVLGGAVYKYGVAQKLLNLALKYHWCLGVNRSLFTAPSIAS